VRELVREHALHLVRRQLLQETLRYGDSRVLRVAAGRERVRLLGRDQVEPRDGHLRALREVLHDRFELGPRPRLDRLRAARLERELVREPVAGDVHQHCERDEEVERTAADQGADRDQ